MLLEREAELGRVDAMLAAAAAGRGQMLVFEGEAGIGKTALLDAAVERARGLRVLRARAGELEREFGYGVVRQLFEPAVHRSEPAEQARMLAGAAARAGALLGVDGALPHPVAPGEDPTFALLHALYWLADNLAQGTPLLLAVDDAQWADLPSLRFLDHLARRLDGMPVGVVVTWRSGEPDAPEALLDGMRRQPAVEVAGLRALSAKATRELVRGTVGEADEAFCDACHESTTGNPFLLDELVGAVRRGQLAPTADAARRVGEFGAGAITRSVFLRLAQLSPAATRLARAVAVLDVDGDLHRAGRLGEVAAGDLHEAAAALQRSRILAPDEPLRFVHPILRGAIYHDLTSAERDALHRRAATVLSDSGDEDRAAAHLLLTEPADEQAVVEQLLAAGRRALERGSGESAARLLQRAADEPARALRFEVLLALGEALTRIGRPAELVLRQAAELAEHPFQRLQATLMMGLELAHHQKLEQSVEELDRAVEIAAGLDAGAMLLAEAWRGSTALCVNRLRPQAEERLARVAAGRAGQADTERHVLATLAFARTMRMAGTAAEAHELIARARGEDDLRDGLLISWSPMWLVFALGFSGRIDESEALCGRLVARYREAGHAAGLATALGWHANAAFLRGDLQECESLTQQSLEIAGTDRFLFGRPWRAWMLAESRLLRGDVRGADAVLQEHGYGGDFPDGDMLHGALPRRGLALVRLAQGRRDEALAEVDALIDLTVAGGGLTAVVHSETPGLLHALGRPQDAVDFARELVADARRWGEPLGLATSLRALGVVTGGEEGLAHLGEAISLLEGSDAKLEHATALVAYGSALRRANERQACRDPLRRGGELAERCGAAPLAQRAREELEATGARSRSLVLSGVESLTASERRVARMAADGLTNTEIAQTLYVTRKTVETHLRHAFQKLDIASRRELPEALEPDLRVPA